MPAKRTDVVRQLAAVPGLGDGGYVLANNQDSAGRALEWWRQVLAAGGEPRSAADVVGLAAQAPAGAGGVVFTPWLTGERSPIDDRAARGGFHNLGMGATAAEMSRAVLEGVAFNLRWLLEGVEALLKRRADPIRLLGGGARADLWAQTLADVCDRAFERVAEPMVAGLRGAALTWSLAAGEVSWGEVNDLVPVDRTFTSDRSIGPPMTLCTPSFPGCIAATSGFSPGSTVRPDAGSLRSARRGRVNWRAAQIVGYGSHAPRNADPAR